LHLLMDVCLEPLPAILGGSAAFREPLLFELICGGLGLGLADHKSEPFGLAIELGL